MSSSVYITPTKTLLRKLNISRCHQEMIVNDKLEDNYIVSCSYCMRRDYIPKKASNNE